MDLSNINEKIIDLKLQGNCCSQVIMQLSLDAMEKEDNADLMAAMRGLCGGMHRGSVCGALSAAACAIFLSNSAEAQSLNDELFDWFEDEFGSIDCDELLEGNPANKTERCPVYMDSVYKKLQELLDWYDD